MKQSAREFWITGANLVTQDEARKLLPATNVRVVDGVIAQITRRAPGARARVVDAEGLYLLPGFVQTHLHLCQTLFRNLADDLELMDWLQKKIWRFEAAHDARSMALSAELGIRELLGSGTTCILDMGSVRHTDEIFRTATRLGIRANIGKCLMDHPKLAPRGLREEGQAALTEALTLFKRWNGTSNDRIRASFAPRFALSCTDELLRGTVRIARERGAIVHTHACENREEMRMVKRLTGRENLEYLGDMGILSDRTVLAHGVWVDQRGFARLKRTGTSLTHCPSSNLKLASGLAPIVEARRAGVRVSLGADGAPCNNRLDAFSEMRLASLLQKLNHGPRALGAHEVLDMATRDGAKALHWWDKIGSIEVGKRADFVALDLDSFSALQPLARPTAESVASTIVYSAGPAQVVGTWVDGRRVYSRGERAAAGLARDARTALKRILARA